jgi:hypothetical protein
VALRDVADWAGGRGAARQLRRNGCGRLVSGVVVSGSGGPMKHNEPVIHSDPEIIRGRAAASEFLEDFPTVTREQAVAALDQLTDLRGS